MSAASKSANHEERVGQVAKAMDPIRYGDIVTVHQGRAEEASGYLTEAEDFVGEAGSGLGEVAQLLENADDPAAEEALDRLNSYQNSVKNAAGSLEKYRDRQAGIPKDDDRLENGIAGLGVIVIDGPAHLAEQFATPRHDLPDMGEIWVDVEGEEVIGEPESLNDPDTSQKLYNADTFHDYHIVLGNDGFAPVPYEVRTDGSIDRDRVPDEFPSGGRHTSMLYATEASLEYNGGPVDVTGVLLSESDQGVRIVNGIDDIQTFEYGEDVPDNLGQTVQTEYETAAKAASPVALDD